MKPGAVIEAIVKELEDEPNIRALFLSGSYGAGLEDAYSDIDFLMVASDGLTDEIVKLWHRAVSRTGEIVLWRDRQVRPVLINAITHDWSRTDVVILKPAQMGEADEGQSEDPVRPRPDIRRPACIVEKHRPGTATCKAPVRGVYPYSGPLAPRDGQRRISQWGLGRIPLTQPPHRPSYRGDWSAAQERGRCT